MPDTVGDNDTGRVVAIGLEDIVYETEVVIDLVNGKVVGIPVCERVCVTD